MKRYTAYQVLGVSEKSTLREIRSAYIRAIRAAHPDAGGDLKAAQWINAAWGILKNEEIRRKYDEALAKARRPVKPARVIIINRREWWQGTTTSSTTYY